MSEHFWSTITDLSDTEEDHDGKVNHWTHVKKSFTHPRDLIDTLKPGRGEPEHDFGETTLFRFKNRCS